MFPSACNLFVNQIMSSLLLSDKIIAKEVEEKSHRRRGLTGLLDLREKAQEDLEMSTAKPE